MNKITGMKAISFDGDETLWGFEISSLLGLLEIL